MALVRSKTMRAVFEFGSFLRAALAHSCAFVGCPNAMCPAAMVAAWSAEALFIGTACYAFCKEALNFCLAASLCGLPSAALISC